MLSALRFSLVLLRGGGTRDSRGATRGSRGATRASFMVADMDGLGLELVEVFGNLRCWLCTPYQATNPNQHQPQPTPSNTIQRRPTTANINNQQRPTSTNTNQHEPTPTNANQRRQASTTNNGQHQPTPTSTKQRQH